MITSKYYNKESSFLPKEFQIIRDHYLYDEKTLVSDYIQYLKNEEKSLNNARTDIETLMSKVRKSDKSLFSMDVLMHVFKLSSPQGRALMQFAESLLRIPDNYTKNKLIKDKLTGVPWNVLVVPKKYWALRAFVQSIQMASQLLRSPLGNTPLIKVPIRKSVEIGVNMIGKQFIYQSSIQGALERLKHQNSHKNFVYSFDMLGEAAMTEKDAVLYLQKYHQALDVLQHTADPSNPQHNHGISVKLSAIFSRYEFKTFHLVHDILYKRLFDLCVKAKKYHLPLFVDAEEVERLEISLLLFERLAQEEVLKGWDGLGIVVQSYQKRARYVVQWIDALSKKTGFKFLVRLVKGAYWDMEIKLAQTKGLKSFPVFTRRSYTDISYLATAKQLFECEGSLFPCFATHNAQTMLYIQQLAQGRPFEFQKLYGMGDMIYKDIQQPVRVYAPVGQFDTLLPYLVRRLLENGANSSFVSQILDEQLSIKDLSISPIDQAISCDFSQNPATISPLQLFTDRKNSLGIDMTDFTQLEQLQKDINSLSFPIKVSSLLHGVHLDGETHKTFNPGNLDQHIGDVVIANAEQLKGFVQIAKNAFTSWDSYPIDKRSEILEKAADLLENRMGEFIGLINVEAGRTLEDAMTEVREAVDFLRYYAQQGRNLFKKINLPGPTGEENVLLHHGRGIFVCIAPWNFPLSIFTGQVSAALVTGNTVIAKPSSQTPIVAYSTIKLLHEAGVPKDVLQLVLAPGRLVSEVILSNTDTHGVVLTGSTEASIQINRVMATRDAGIPRIIAETGGQNALIVDSSALTEQVTRDIIRSAFQSAGQRCSALRVLYVQEDVADKQIEMIIGALNMLIIDQQNKLKTDVGPLIDQAAYDRLEQHVQDMKEHYKVLARASLPSELSKGYYFAPTICEIPSIKVLKEEFFGPILHVVRYKAQDFEQVLKDINSVGFGLTIAMESRIQNDIATFIRTANVGNIYINRNQIGAMIESQPFGGEGLSGTGPKAGGPAYLSSFVYEKSVSTDTTAEGGNISLMSKA